MSYGYGQKWEQYVFPGTKAYLKTVPGDEIKKPYKKNEDPWHNIWEMEQIDGLLKKREEAAEDAAEENNIF